MQKKPIGQILKEEGFIREEHIEFALKEQKATGERLGEVLTRIGIVTDFEIAKVVAKQANMDFLDTRTVNPDPAALAKIPARFARDRTVLPFALEKGALHVAISDPFDQVAIEGITSFAGARFKPFIAPENELKKMIEWHYYFLETPVDKEIEKIQQTLVRNPSANIPVDDLIRNILVLGIVNRATDIHISPTAQTSRIFYRIDGLLDLAFVFPITVHSRLVSAIKVRSGMDIAERRLPQDGRMSFEFLGESYDLRVSTVQLPRGENLVIRLLPTRSTILHLSSLGFSSAEVAKLEELFRKPYGMVLVTGPTGSGKTTTLYSALRMIDVIHLNVLTVENPIEYNFPLIRQTQTLEEIGYDFSTAIRHFMRQDPDVILVGEIRDEKTAQMAIRAALTGHLLLSTVHANNAISAIPRLREFGITPEMLASTLLGITAQRLVRTICPHCKELYKPETRLLAKFNLPPEGEYYHGKGCQHCRGKGYIGRTSITEIIIVSERLQKLIAENATITAMLDVLKEENFQDLRESAKQKILSGITTVEEANRVLG
ncbi:MAG: GspE/PulE family protein [Thermodesulforhabdaceae bacterium]